MWDIGHKSSQDTMIIWDIGHKSSQDIQWQGKLTGFNIGAMYWLGSELDCPPGQLTTSQCPTECNHVLALPVAEHLLQFT